MKRLLIFLSIFITGISQAQSLNDYKYVVVDNQYEFQKKANQYRLNEMMVFELKKRDLVAYRNIEVLPLDFNKGICNALSLKVDASSGLRVKLTFQLINCSGDVVFSSEEGIGRTKKFEKAYREALRDAMSSLDEVEYAYKQPEYVDVLPGSSSIDSVRVNSGQPGKVTIKEPETTVAVAPIIDKKASDSQMEPKNTDVEKKELKDLPPPEPELVELVGDQIYRSTSKVYILQPVPTGFDMIKNKFKIGTLKKSASGCYLAVTADFTGIGYEKGDDLIIEYDQDGTQFLVFKKQK